MEKLSASERKSIWSNFCTAFDSYEPPRHGYDYEKAHVIKSKLRCAYSAILLHKCGLLDESALPLAVLSPDLISQFLHVHLIFWIMKRYGQSIWTTPISFGNFQI